VKGIKAEQGRMKCQSTFRHACCDAVGEANIFALCYGYVHPFSREDALFLFNNIIVFYPSNRTFR
jgi:hypothetical protein